MRQVLCPVLVGREDEVQVLLDGVDRAVGGAGGAFVVTGEAGVGKSRLVREVAQVAGARGLSVLAGRAVAGGAAVPFRPLAEAVMSGLRRFCGLDLAELRSFRPALGPLVPEWLAAEPIPGARSPVVLGEALLRLLHVLGAERGCLLVLEDLHWADRESLSILEYLADNLATERLVCLATIRAEEGGAGRSLVDSLVARRAVQAVELARLDDEATLRLARASLSTTALPAAVESFLGAHADGLPFLIEELLAGLVARGVLVEHEGHWTTRGPLDRRIPPTFADAVDRRLAVLPSHARSVLHAAALLGRHFEWSLLPAATGLGEAEVVTALRQAIGAQLVTAEDGGFRFRHSLTRETVLGDLAAPERATLAGRLLQAVDRAQPDLAGAWCELAADLAEAAGDRTRAAQLWLTAGRRAVTAGALATAQVMLRRARRLAPGDAELTLPIDLALTDVLAQSGEVDQAFELGRTLLARLDAASRHPVVRADLHLRLARAGVAAGRWRVAADHLAAIQDVSAELQAGTLAVVNALGAQVALGEARLGEADRLATAALTVAERDGLPAVACEALEVLGRVARQRDLPAAEASFTRELAVATAHRLQLWRLRALHELGTVDQLRTESVDRLRQARDLAAEVGALALIATLDLQIAAGLIKQFRHEEGLASARGSAEMSRRLRLATLPMALVLQSAAYAQLGRIDDMEAGLREALTLAPDDLDVQGSAWGHCRATASLLAEERERALTEMTTGARLLQRSPATVAPPFLGLRVLLLAVSGDHDAARAETDRVRDSGATRHRVVASLLGYAEAVLLGRTGRDAEAAAAFAAADAEMGPLVAWYRQYARRSVAEAALADGWGDPVPWLREAAAYFAARGDHVVAAACRALLRRAGIPVPRPGQGDPRVPAKLRALGVTSREAEVLALLAEGLTNQEVGARLHLSPRTVEKHVAGLLAKTGCRRRAQLAGYSARLSP